MANQSQLSLLQMVARETAKSARWNALLAQESYIDLSRADLSNHNLAGLNFSGVDFSGAKLFNANLSGANLARATLPYADMRRANLAKARLSEANLMAANLSGANMVETELARANLQGATMAGVYLVKGNLTGGRLERADLRGANLKFTKFEDATLDKANVEDADFSRALINDEQLAKTINLKKAITAPGNGGATAAGAKLGTSRPAPSRPAGNYEDLFQETDSHRILEVEPGSSLEEVTKAYRQRAKEYHPDRVAHLGKKLQEVARREFERIQQAYRKLSRQDTRPDVEVSIKVGPGSEVKVGPDYTLEHYEALAERYPNDDRILFNLGNKYFEANNLEQAAIAFRRALDINPANDGAEHNLKIVTLMSQFSKN